MYRRLEDTIARGTVSELRSLVLNHGKVLLFMTIGYRRLDMLRYLVENGIADRDSIDDDNWSGLHFAAVMGDVPILRYMLMAGCQHSNTITRYGNTPISLALFGERPVECFYMLFGHGSTLTSAADPLGSKLLCSAVRRGLCGILETIIWHGIVAHDTKMLFDIAAGLETDDMIITMIRLGMEPPERIHPVNINRANIATLAALGIGHVQLTEETVLAVRYRAYFSYGLLFRLLLESQVP